MTRHEFSTATKQQEFARANGKCRSCRAVLKISEGEYDHIIPCKLGGTNELANCQLLCRVCHGAKTKGDVGSIAKAKRIEKRHTGIVKPKGQIKSRGFQKLDRTQHNRTPLPPRQLYQ